MAWITMTLLVSLALLGLGSGEPGQNPGGGSGQVAKGPTTANPHHQGGSGHGNAAGHGHGNTGHGNTGHGNTVDPHAGHGNPVDPHAGHGNTYDPHAGHGNTYDPHAGHGNTYDPHAGTGNTYDPHAGHGNTYDPHAGHGNTYDPHAGTGNTYDPHAGHGNTYDPHAGHGNTYDPHAGTGNTYDPHAGHGNTYDPYAGHGNTYDPHAGYANTYDPHAGTGNAYDPYGQGNTGHAPAHGGGAHFDYSVHGQDWKYDYSKCSGRGQSPVNLPVFSDYSMHTEFKFLGFNRINKQWVLTNNGHSAKVTPQGNAPMEVSGGGLYGTYVVDQFHFHWPSEHTINHMYYPMEMHVVTHNKKYPNLQTAMQYPDGLAVLGVMFEVSHYKNPHFEKLVQHLNWVNSPGTTTAFQPDQPLEALLPYDRKVFDRYHGSLTTPPCSEAVTWTIFQDTVKIAESQLNMFTNSLLDSNSNTLKQNFRQTQPLFGRVIQVNHKK